MRYVASLIIPFGILMAGCGGRTEPILVHGKPVDHWLRRLQHPDAMSRKKAVGVLGHVASISEIDPVSREAAPVHSPSLYFQNGCRQMNNSQRCIG
jgi:hypothetical protein